MNGTASNDTLTGTSLSDVFTSSLGNDNLSGGLGNDTFKETDGDGSDTLDGGIGIDTVSYLDSVSIAALTLDAVSGVAIRDGDIDSLINIEKVIGTKALTDTFNAAADTDGFVFSLTSGVVSGLTSGITSATLFENIIGGSGNDQLTGSTRANNINGGAGNDIIYSSAGKDTLNGGTGTDTLMTTLSMKLDLVHQIAYFANEISTLNSIEIIKGSGALTDTIDSSGDTDGVMINLSTGTFNQVTTAVVSFSGFENVIGGSGNDTLIGNSLNNILTGGLGNDTLDGGAGNDTFTCTIGDGDNRIMGGLGIDTVTYDNNVLSASEVTLDLITGTVTRAGQTDTLIGIEKVIGSDSLHDTLTFATGSAAGIVNLTSGAIGGIDGTIVSILQFENIIGGSDSDTLTGNASANVLIGNDGNDILNGYAGNDTLDGGAGNDTYVFNTGWGVDIIKDSAGSDTLDLSKISKGFIIDLNTTTSITMGANSITWDAHTIENVIGGVLNDVITGTAENNILGGGNGNDTLAGGAGDDTYVFTNSFGSDLIIDTAGQDTLDFSKVTSAVTINLNSSGINNEALMGSFKVNWADNAIENAIGGIGNDRITGNSLDNILTGGVGNDTLDGGAGNDTLYGGDGNDTFYSSLGNDLIDGGSGMDTLIAQEKVIYDVQRGQFSIGDNVLTNFVNLEFLQASGSTEDTIDASSCLDNVFIDLTLNTITSSNSGLGNTSLKFSGFEDALGGIGNDSLTGNSAANRLDGGEGNDTIYSGGGADTLIGGSGWDWFVAQTTVTFNGDTNIVTFNGVSCALTGFEVVYGSNGVNDTYQALSDTDGVGVDLQTGLTSGAAGGIEFVRQFENVIGGSGNDTFVGDMKANSLTGNGANDTLNGGGGNDILNGGIGHDTYLFSNGWGMDTILDSQGIDTLDFSTLSTNLVLNFSAASGKVISGVNQVNWTGEIMENALLGSGDDSATGNTLSNTFHGGFGNDRLFGLGGNDILYGDSGNDTLDGGTGQDSLIGGLGNDTYIVDNAGDAVLENAFEGIDTVQASIHYTLADNVENLTLTGSSNLNGTGNDLDNIIIGNIGANSLIGAAGDDKLYGEDGNDSLAGNDGNDILDGGTGDDTLRGEAGDDTYYFTGSWGHDIVADDTGVDTFDFSAIVPAVIIDLSLTSMTQGNNSITWDSSVIDNIVGGKGFDFLYGNQADNMIWGGDGQDWIEGFGGDDQLFGGNGPDFIFGGAGNDLIVGGLDEDLPDNFQFANMTLRPDFDRNTQFDILHGGTGNDTIYGGGGLDTHLDDSLDNDLIYGDEGNDVLYGQGGNDFLYGGLGNDILYGQNGNDVLDGGYGDDILYGGEGDNGLSGGIGNDTLVGGTGEDTYNFDYYSWGQSIIFDSGGIDRINIGIIEYSVTINLNSSDGHEAYWEGGSIDWDGDIIENVSGSSSSDLIIGNNDDNKLDGGIGNDTIDGGAGNDILIGNYGNDLLSGGDGNDHLLGQDGMDTLDGGTGNDSIEGGSGNDILYGNEGDDTLIGGQGSDELYGGGGNDLLIAGGEDQGSALMVGGSGNDVYLTNGNTSIQDSEGTDTLQFNISPTSNVNFYAVDGADSDNNLDSLVIDIDGNMTITIENYFDNSTISPNDISSGAGLIESIILGDNIVNLDFLHIRSLLNTDSNIDTDIKDDFLSPSSSSVINHLYLGGNGNDTLMGGSVGDNLMGSNGNDFISGGGDGDTINGGFGNDTLIGGTGSDNYYFDDNWGNDTITEVQDTPTGNSIFCGNISHDLVVHLTAGTWSEVTDGINTINWDDNFVFNKSQGFGSGSGNDLIYGVDSDSNIAGNNGNDTIYGGIGRDVLNGGSGNDLLYGGGGADYIMGEEGNDIIINTSDNVSDYIVAGDGNDIVICGDGDDMIDGGAGADTLQGGGGNDTYIGVWGTDIIDDASGTDRLDNTNYFNLADAISWTAVDGDDTDTFVDQLVIRFTPGFSLTILNYFDNTSLDAHTSGPGTGLIETIMFTDDPNVDFAQVQALIA